MKDPAFKMFVIMMQPVETLEKFSIYMGKFSNQKTYLPIFDPRLFKKIANYLKWVKKREGGKEPKVELNGQTMIVENKLR